MASPKRKAAAALKYPRRSRLSSKSRISPRMHDPSQSTLHMVKQNHQGRPHVAAPVYASVRGRNSRPTKNTLALHRNSGKQLNVAMSGKIYECAKSRRTRTRAALEESGQSKSAIALGAHRKSTMNRNRSGVVQGMDGLESQLEKNSFARAARIRDGLKRKLAGMAPARQPKQPRTPKKTTVGKSRITQEGRRSNARLDHTINSPEQIRNQGGNGREKNQPTCEKANNVATMTANIEKSVLCLLNSDSEDSDSETDERSNKFLTMDTRTNRGHRSDQVGPVVKAEMSSGPKANEIALKQDIIDLIDDEDDDGDMICSKNDPKNVSKNSLQDNMTRLLLDDAIGRGADRKEMERYAQELLNLGLHSKDMILDTLSEEENSIQNLEQVVQKWNWMKEFHKIVFRKWVMAEHQKAKHPKSADTSENYRRYSDISI